MEQRAVVSFFTLKGLNPRDIHAELTSIDGPMDSFCEQSTNGASAELKGERSFPMIRDLSDPYGMISLKLFALCFRIVLLLHARDFVSTSGLRWRRAFIYCKMFCS
jgi:hypothetical protein